MPGLDQSSLEAQLDGLSSSAKLKIQKVIGLQNGELKDAESAVEHDFSSMRAVMRELEFLAEDHEEEEDETVLGRLQRYKQQYQDIQIDYSKAKMMKKLDPREENRKLLLAGGDPARRQRELQSEAEVLGAAQSTTGSLQRSRQIMLEQVDTTKTLLASMDASHAQLHKVTTEYQGQSDVFGSSKRLLRTLKRHSTWDKFVLYGGFAMLLLVCLYVVQKRARYFVPTFVKTGVGKLVPSWSRSSAQDLDDLTRPVKAQGDDSGTAGLRQKPTPDTLRNADQAEKLLQRHAAKQEPSEPQKQPPKPGDALGAPATPALKTNSSPTASPAEPSTPTQKEPDRRYVTQKQMDESGHGGAFAKILASIPDNVRNSGPQETETADASGYDASDTDAGLESMQQDQGSSSEEGLQEAVPAAVEQATGQQRLLSLSLDAGQAYPENTAQISSGEQALPRHAALLSNTSSHMPASAHDATLVNHTEGRQASADGQQPSSSLQGALPDSLIGNNTSMSLQENVTGAIQQMLNSSLDDSEASVEDKGDSSVAEISAEQPFQADQQQTDTIMPAGNDAQQAQSGPKGESADEANVHSTGRQSTALSSQDSSDGPAQPTVGNLDGTVNQTQTQGLASLSNSKSRQSVPQIGAVDDQQESDRRFVSQQQMDESGHADAFAGIVNAVPHDIKDQLPDKFKPDSAVASPPAQEDNMPADSNTTHLDANSTQTSAMQRDEHAEL
ncbi:hypothetical protein WJX77_000762 [Trebouxia sp. C0004]